MEIDQTALSAYWTAAVRARESRRSDRLFHDSWAETLAGQRGRDLLRDKEQRQGRPDILLPVRTRWFDDLLLRHLDEGVISQVVELGAGLDTRPYRLALPPHIRTFELDQPETLAYKHTVLEASGARSVCATVSVGADLATDAWADLLQAAGLDVTQPTIWIAEGVLMYLAPNDARRLLEQVTQLCPSGSVLEADTLANRRNPDGSRSYQTTRFCPDDAAAEWDELGWNIATITTIAKPARAYRRLTERPPHPETQPPFSYYLVAAHSR